MIKLIILDIDGVLTDGTKAYDIDGSVMSKSFHDHDFSAIKRLKTKKMSVCFLSGDDRVNRHMAKERKIPFYNSRGNNKEELLKIICQDFGVTTDNVAFVGDDIPDLAAMQSVSYPFCPKDAVKQVKKLCEERGIILDRLGGRGVVDKLYDFLYVE